jgi:phosphatidylethanolamine-binding protein (PEBP) family uncharacterized protein
MELEMKTKMKRYLSVLKAFPIIISALFICVTGVSASDKNLETLHIASPGSMTEPSTEGVSSQDMGRISNDSRFVLRSPDAVEGGMLPKEYTCDGDSSTLPLEWSGVPVGTKSLAVVMHTIPGPNESHWYWVLYNIPPDMQGLVKNVAGVGTPGNNSVNGRMEYAPPCSKGPGPKLYTYTVYALSGHPKFAVPQSEVSRDVLLAAIKDMTLAKAELNVFYSR